MTALKSFAEMLYKLDQQFIRDIRLPVRVEGKQGAGWLAINKDNLKGMFDFKPVSISMIGNRMARQNTLNRFAEVLAKMPPIPPLARQMLDEYEFTNAEEIMMFLCKMWGMNPDGTPLMPVMPPGMPPMPGGPVPPPVNNNAQVGQNLSKLLAAGAR